MSAKIDFGDGSWQQASGVIHNRLEAHEATLYGNGREGIVKRVDSFIAAYEGRQKLLNFLIIANIGILGVAVTVIGLFMGHK